MKREIYRFHHIKTNIIQILHNIFAKRKIIHIRSYKISKLEIILLFWCCKYLIIFILSNGKLILFFFFEIPTNNQERLLRILHDNLNFHITFSDMSTIVDNTIPIAIM